MNGSKEIVSFMQLSFVIISKFLAKEGCLNAHVVLPFGGGKLQYNKVNNIKVHNF